MRLFFLNGFGYMADSLVLLLQSVTAGQAALEFKPSFADALTVAAYSGMLVGALFWGLGADVIGRKFAFNCSLFVCRIFAIVAGASPNWYVLALFTSLAAFGGGGNLVLDTAVFLEFLPSRQAWLLTLMAAWWGLAPVIAAAFCWPFLSQARWNCGTNASNMVCTYSNNMVCESDVGLFLHADAVSGLALRLVRERCSRFHHEYSSHHRHSSP
jgi:MFS family permease